jgi:hypothetical protein
MVVQKKIFLPLLGIELWPLGGTAHYHVTITLTFHSLFPVNNKTAF